VSSMMKAALFVGFTEPSFLRDILDLDLLISNHALLLLKRYRALVK
jgi:hypothetical protein